MTIVDMKAVFWEHQAELPNPDEGRGPREGDY